ncbi:MAG TPA: PAS domain S-box protein, partial [Gammaproteobacteria bacterium]|nr:PAS domain S-box protein [Gammaproteobacteria bacterium]
MTKQAKKMARCGNNKRRAKRVRHSIAASNRAIMPPHQGNDGSQSNSIAFRLRVARLNKNGAPIRSTRTPAIWNPQTELEAATQRFVDLYDFAPIAYVSFDRAGRIEEANLATTALLGVARDLLIGRPFAFYIADLDSFLQHLFLCRAAQEKVATELELKPRKGERIPVQLLSTPITSTLRNGALLYQTAIIDLSERKRHEQQLAEQARLLDLSNDAIIVRDVNDRVTYWNKGATKIYGYSLAEATGEVSHQLLKTGYPEPLSRIYQKLLRDKYWQGELVHTRRDGSRITVFSRWVLDRDAQGKRAYVLETNNDISEQKVAEQQQEALYQFAQRQSAAGSLQEIYEAALDTILAAVGCDRAAILLFDDKQIMRFVAWRGLSKAYRKAVEGHSPWGRTRRNQHRYAFPTSGA